MWHSLHNSCSTRIIRCTYALAVFDSICWDPLSSQCLLRWESMSITFHRYKPENFKLLCSFVKRKKFRIFQDLCLCMRIYPSAFLIVKYIQKFQLEDYWNHRIWWIQCTTWLRPVVVYFTLIGPLGEKFYIFSVDKSPIFYGNYVHISFQFGC